MHLIVDKLSVQWLERNGLDCSSFRCRMAEVESRWLNGGVGERLPQHAQTPDTYSRSECARSPGECRHLDVLPGDPSRTRTTTVARSASGGPIRVPRSDNVARVPGGLRRRRTSSRRTPAWCCHPGAVPERSPVCWRRTVVGGAASSTGSNPTRRRRRISCELVGPPASYDDRRYSLLTYTTECRPIGYVQLQVRHWIENKTAPACCRRLLIYW